MDPYKILGLTKPATNDAIERAYRKQAKLWHPDVNHSPGAEARFKDIQLAHAQLTGKVKYEDEASSSAQSSTPRSPSSFNDFGVPNINFDFLFDELRKTTDRMGSMRPPIFPDPTYNLFEQAGRRFDAQFTADSYGTREQDTRHIEAEQIRMAGQVKAAQYRNSVSEPISKVYADASDEMLKVDTEAEAQVREIHRVAQEQAGDQSIYAIFRPEVRQQVEQVRQAARDKSTRIRERADAHVQNMRENAESFALFAIEEAERQARALLAR